MFCFLPRFIIRAGKILNDSTRGKGRIDMKKHLAIVLATILVLSLVGCSGQTMTFDIGEASKITVKAGSDGEEAIVTDEALIEKITADINSLSFEKTAAADGNAAYVYVLVWFDAENNPIADIVITEENGYQICYDGFYYKVDADLSIDMEWIDAVFRNISSS